MGMRYSLVSMMADEVKQLLRNPGNLCRLSQQRLLLRVQLPWAAMMDVCLREAVGRGHLIT